MDIGLVSRRDEHHLGIGDLDDVAAGDNRIGPALQNDVVQPNPIASIDADVPGRGLPAVIENLRVQTRDKLAWTQINMDVGEGPCCDRNGTGLLVQLRFAIRFAPDIDMQCFDIIGPVAAGDFCICADTLRVLRLLVRVVPSHAHFFPGDVQAGYDQVHQVLVGGQFIFGGRVVGLIGGFLRFGGTGRRRRMVINLWEQSQHSKSS